MFVFLQTVFAKGAHYALKEVSESGYDVVGLDWTMVPEEVRCVYVLFMYVGE